MRKHPVLVQIGARIRALREDRKFSQEGFAADADFDRTYYGGVERGERNLSAVNLVRIAAALDVEVGELFPKVSLLATASNSSRGRRTKKSS